MNHAYHPLYNAALNAWIAALLAALAGPLHALPTGGQVSAGAGTITQAGAGMTVNQSSQNLAINWQSFNIGAGERVSFVQPNASSIALNRVLGADPSAIRGQLSANGQVWLLNPNGILFGKSAQVDTGGLVAATLNISDADFLAGKRSFAGSVANNSGTVTNQGTINASYVALLGGQVANEGSIVARLGTIALAAGERVTLDFAGDRLLNVQVDAGALKALVDNKGLIQADGGMVLMTAKAKDALLDTAVNNSGVIQARSIEEHNGVIKLLGDMDSGTVNVAGTLDASAPNGGQGTNGGFIETSAAHVKVADGAHITTAAPNGKAGTWLIDPIDFTIAAGSGALTTSGIGATTLSTNLGGGNVAIATDASTGGNGDIFVNSAVSWSANKLTLTAHRNIAINANLNGSGTASLALEYGQASAGGGGSDYTLGNGARVNLPAGSNFSTKLGTGGATTAYTVITSLGVEGDATVAPATMTLQGMNGNLAGNYALGANIDASATSGWNGGGGFAPVGGNVILPAVVPEFIGRFDGLGHTITGLTIKNQWTDFRGLFGYASSAAILRNVGLISSTVEGRNSVGTLLGGGATSPIISYSYADGGSVTAHGNNGGGLVGGCTSANISYSYANVSVIGDGSAGGDSNFGGLAGVVGAVSNSYATGSVYAGQSVGGLVGNASGAITNSYAAGAVSARTGTDIGGLVGKNNGGSATNSYWNWASSGQATSAIGTRIGTSNTDTASIQAQASFTGFDFTTTPVWRIYEGHTTPLLASFLTPLTVTANNASTTYSGTAYSGGSVSYSATPNANLLGTVSIGGGAVTPGSYTITPSGYWSNQRGYDITYASGTLMVSPAALTVTANAASKTYDGLAWSGNNGVAFSGFVNGEGTGVLVGTLAYGGTAQGAINAGSYLITPSGLTAGNYIISYVSGALTVNKAPLTVTANAASKTYDGLAYAGGNGVGYSGFVNGEGTGVLVGTLAYGGTSQGAVNAGSYLITPSGLIDGSNYAISYVSGALTVNKAPLTVTASAASKTYDGLAYSGGNGIGYSGFVNGETGAALGGTLAWGGTSQSAINAGNYSITPSGLTSDNYSISFADGTLTVNKAPLTVTANDVNKTYNGTAYRGGHGVRYTGFVNGEEVGALGGTLAWGGTAQGAMVAGTYAIVPSGLSANNYSLAYADGILTIRWPVAPTVTGAPVGGYTGAIAGFGTGGAGSNGTSGESSFMTLVATADDNSAKTETADATADKPRNFTLLAAGNTQPGMGSPFFIENCGQRLPSAIAADCR